MNTFKTLTAAAALLAIAGTAQAQTDSATYCRLRAAALWPNTLDAWENEMRTLTYQKCMAGAARLAAAPTVDADQLCTHTWNFYGGHPEAHPKEWAMCATARTRQAAQQAFNARDRAVNTGVRLEALFGDAAPSIPAICSVTQIPLSPLTEDCLVKAEDARTAEINRFVEWAMRQGH